MTDVTKLKFLSGTLREDRQGTYDYITLLKQGLTALGVTYPSSGSGGGWDFNETMSANRTKTMAGYSVTIQGQNLSTSPVPLIFNNTYTSANGGNEFLRVNPAYVYNTGGNKSAPVEFFYTPFSNGDGTSNNVFGYGTNWLNRDSTRHQWTSRIEDDWVSGGARYTEYHLATIWLPDGAVGETRLLSGTFIRRSTMALSDMTWDFRATVYNFKDLQDNSIFGIAPNTVNLYGLSPIFYIRDNLDASFYTYLQQGGADAEISTRRHITITSRGSGELRSNAPIIAQNTYINSPYQVTQSMVGDPTATQIPNGFWMVYKNTSSGAVKLWANDGGTLKSVTLT